jgi:hypothetical protein
MSSFTCDEGEQDSEALDKAFFNLSSIPGIARATIVALKQGANWGRQSEVRPQAVSSLRDLQSGAHTELAQAGCREGPRPSESAQEWDRRGHRSSRPDEHIGPHRS